MWSGLLILTTVFTADAPPTAANQASTVPELLSHQIVDKELPMAEVRAYCEQRVPPMPEVQSAEAWSRYAKQTRQAVLDRVVFRGEAARWRDARTRVEWLDTLDDTPGYTIKKLRYEALPGLWIPALLYESAELQGKVPIVLNVNGHDRKNGKAAVYKQIRCINQAKRGLVALNAEWLGMGQLNAPGFDHGRMNQIDLCGSSGLAPYYLAMSRALDLLLKHPHADPNRLAVAGLSGGGWQTITISSLDERVTLANPVAGYSSFKTRAQFLPDLGDSEQTPCDLATVTDYAQLTAMRAPRPTLLTFNASDQCCFRADHALDPLLQAARPIFALYQTSHCLRAHINYEPGTHNFERDNREALYRMLGDHFFADDPSFDPIEIACESEVKTGDQLSVPVPPDNLDFHALAMQLSKNLPQSDSPIPSDDAERRIWKSERRTLLRDLVKAKTFSIRAEAVGDDEGPGGTARFWRLHLDDQWTVPAVEMGGDQAKPVALVVADQGRAKATKRVAQLIDRGYRVLAIDPFYFGESKLTQRDYLWGLLIATTGDRPLGIQASQILAVARWAAEHYQVDGVRLIALGPRTSLMTLVGAAIDDSNLSAVEVHDAFSTLHEVLTQNMTVRQAPELFCFALLQHFDIPQLEQLVAVPLEKVGPDDVR